MSVVSMKQLLEAGVHFGHQTRRWNPKMAPYIYMERNGIYIIDLQKTVRKLEDAYNFIRQVSEDGGNVLFVGTKKQAQDAVKEEAERVGMFFVNARWLGGMLTNFKTMRMRIDRLAQLRQMHDDGTFDILPKKEVIRLTGEINRLEKYLGGVKEMKRLPAALFIIDPRKEHNAIAEARKLGIPIVAIVDTNCDPDEIDYIIPGNDDAIRAIRLIAQAMANAVVEGRQGADTAEQLQQADTPAVKDASVSPASASAPADVASAPVSSAAASTKEPAREASGKASAAQSEESTSTEKLKSVAESITTKELKVTKEAGAANEPEAKAEASDETPALSRDELSVIDVTDEEAPKKASRKKVVKKADEASDEVIDSSAQNVPSADADDTAKEIPVKEPVKKTTKKATKAPEKTEEDN